MTIFFTEGVLFIARPPEDVLKPSQAPKQLELVTSVTGECLAVGQVRSRDRNKTALKNISVASLTQGYPSELIVCNSDILVILELQV